MNDLIASPPWCVPPWGVFGHLLVLQVAPVVAAVRSRTQVKAQALFGFGGGKKEAAATTAKSYYICVDCGWVADCGGGRPGATCHEHPGGGMGGRVFGSVGGTADRGETHCLMGSGCQGATTVGAEGHVAACMPPPLRREAAWRKAAWQVSVAQPGACQLVLSLA